MGSFPFLLHLYLVLFFLINALFTEFRIQHRRGRVLYARRGRRGVHQGQRDMDHGGCLRARTGKLAHYERC